MNFVAMDFETANQHPASACSLALVMVRDNKIIDRFYTVINPQMAFDAQHIKTVAPNLHHLVKPGLGVFPYAFGFSVVSHSSALNCKSVGSSKANRK